MMSQLGFLEVYFTALVERYLVLGRNLINIMESNCFFTVGNMLKKNVLLSECTSDASFTC